MSLRATFLIVVGCLVLRGPGLAWSAEFSLIPDSTVVGQNYGYPTGTPGQGPTLPGNIDFVAEAAAFAKNLELTDEIIKGQTFIGFLSPLRFRYRVVDEVSIEAGAILGHNFGDDNGLDIAYPLLRLVFQPDPCDIIVGGTLFDTHWIADALFDDTFEFRRPAEQGFQYRVDRTWLKNDVWIDWRTREKDDRPEQFNVADSTQFRVGGLWLDGQFLWAHEGGQKNSVDCVANNGTCLAGGSYGIKTPTLADGELRFGAYYMQSFQTDNVPGFTASHGEGHEFRVWYDMHPTPNSLLRLYSSAYRGHDFLAWLGDPLYSRNTYSQLGFDLVLWHRGNLRTEWGFENQWVDGRWMNTYQVNFVWGEAFHCLSRRPQSDDRRQPVPQQQWHAPEEIIETPAASSLSSALPWQPAAPLAATAPSPLAAVAPAPLDFATPIRLPPPVPPPVNQPPPNWQPGGAVVPLIADPGAAESPNRQVTYLEEQASCSGQPPSVVFASSAEPAASLPPVPGGPAELTAPAAFPVGSGVARLPGTNTTTGAPRANLDATPDRKQATPPTDDDTSTSYPKRIGDSSFVFESLPQTLLWKVPMANQREPRCFAKLSSENNQPLIDTEIGAMFALSRIGPADNPREGIELGAFAGVFTRFLGQGHPIVGDDREALPLTAIDYRAGLPLMFAKGDWQMKIAYEHTSCHLGDEFMLLDYNYGLHTGSNVTIRAVRDEAVLGIARFFGESLRLYGQTGYSFSPSDSLTGKTPIRYDWGVEYSPPSPPRGGLFAAFDMDLRAEQDFFRNITIQAGWQWKTNENRGSSARIAVEYYDGRSPYGQLYLMRESSWGAVMIYEW